MKLIEDTAKEAAFCVNTARTTLKNFTQEELIKFLGNMRTSEGKPCPYRRALPGLLVKRGLISNIGSKTGIYHFTGDLKNPIHFSIFIETLKHNRKQHAYKAPVASVTKEVSKPSARIHLSEFIDTSRYSKTQLEALETKVAEDIEFLRSLGLKVLKPKPLEYVEL